MTVAVVKSMVPLPLIDSTRSLASYILPSVMPRLDHCLKCSEMEMCPHWRGDWRMLKNWGKVAVPWMEGRLVWVWV